MKTIISLRMVRDTEEGLVHNSLSYTRQGRRFLSAKADFYIFDFFTSWNLILCFRSSFHNEVIEDVVAVRVVLERARDRS